MAGKGFFLAQRDWFSAVVWLQVSQVVGGDDCKYFGPSSTILSRWLPQGSRGVRMPGDTLPKPPRSARRRNGTGPPQTAGHTRCCRRSGRRAGSGRAVDAGLLGRLHPPDPRFLLSVGCGGTEGYVRVPLAPCEHAYRSYIL